MPVHKFCENKKFLYNLIIEYFISSVELILFILNWLLSKNEFCSLFFTLLNIDRKQILITNIIYETTLIFK